MNHLYLHGFASSPSSRKAIAFNAEFASRQLRLAIPALDESDFEHLTISRQLALITRLADPNPTSLIGSSLGGYLAALYASSHPEVSRLVLLAPAFAFAPRWVRSPNVSKDRGLEVFHYGENRLRRVHYRLLEDALTYPDYPDFSQPALIFHGIHDDVVPIENSRQFAATHPNARLIELDSDHELTDSLDAILAQAIPFLLAPPLEP